MLNLADLDGQNGFTIRGAEDYDFSGDYVSNAGDINGDGIDDVVIAAPFADTDTLSSAGQVYVVLGSDAEFG